MEKTMICLSAKKDSGKTSSLKLLFYEILKGTNVLWNNRNDIVGVAMYEGYKIGVASQGDPWLNKKGIEKLIEENCDVIVCAARTHGSTANEVGRHGNEYNIFWITAMRIESNIPLDASFYRLCHEKNASLIMQLIQSIHNA